MHSKTSNRCASTCKRSSADDQAFARALNAHRVLVLPGTIVETPGWFRISLTASDEMVERGLLGFAAALAKARQA